MCCACYSRRKTVKIVKADLYLGWRVWILCSLTSDWWEVSCCLVASALAKPVNYNVLKIHGVCPLIHCRDMFDHPNRKAMEVILFFLFNKLNPQRAKAEFK